MWIWSQKFVYGPYGYATTVLKTFVLPPNKQLELSAGIWKLDSWDSEGFEILANNILLENLILTDHDGVQTCRNGAFEDLYYHFVKRFQISQPNLTIRFVDRLNQRSGEDLWDESWGLRDFILSAKIPCVNFYSECNYTGDYLQICQGEQTKLQNSVPFQIKSILIGPGTVVKLKGPGYFGGTLQEFTSSISCLDSYNFPKVEYQM